MTHSFRLRVNRAARNTIQTDLPRIDLPSEEAGSQLSICASTPDHSIKTAQHWSLIGKGYQSEDAAFEAGTRFSDVLMVCLAKLRIGVDFGDRAPKGFVTAYGRRLLEQQAGKRVLNDVHGLMAYPSDPKPSFATMTADGVRGVSVESFEREFTAAFERKTTLTERERIAHLVFNSSFFQPSADARFLMLMMAVEVLIEPKRRSEAAVGYVSRFVKEISAAPLEQDEQDSLVGSLRWLKSESISQAGRRLAIERLGNKKYHEKTALDFFTRCYALRSNLVHGNVPLPTFAEVSGTVGILEEFVSDLLTTRVQIGLNASA